MGLLPIWMSNDCLMCLILLLLFYDFLHATFSIFIGNPYEIDACWQIADVDGGFRPIGLALDYLLTKHVRDFNLFQVIAHNHN